jgi:hypothetical protein
VSDPDSDKYRKKAGDLRRDYHRMRNCCTGCIPVLCFCLIVQSSWRNAQGLIITKEGMGVMKCRKPTLKNFLINFLVRPVPESMNQYEKLPDLIFLFSCQLPVLLDQSPHPDNLQPLVMRDVF